MTPDAGTFAPALFRSARAAFAGGEVSALPGALTGNRPRALLAALARRCGPSADADVEAARHHVLRAAVATNLMLVGSFQPVAGGFEKAGIRWAALKGLDHLARLYPGLEWREMTDVDLLVRREDVRAAEGELGALGFEPFVGTPAVQPGRCFTKGMASIDLHRRLVRRGGFVEDLDWLLSETRLVHFYGCPVRLMAAPQALAAHALLLGKDGFFASMVRAERIAELGLLADAAGTTGEAEAWVRLERWGAGRVAWCARDIVDWLREGRRPLWIEDDFGEQEAGFGKPPAMIRRLLRGAWLQGSALNAARWSLVQSRSFALQRFSGRRWGSWDAEA